MCVCTVAQCGRRTKAFSMARSDATQTRRISKFSPQIDRVAPCLKDMASAVRQTRHKASAMDRKNCQQSRAKHAFNHCVGQVSTCCTGRIATAQIKEKTCHASVGNKANTRVSQPPGTRKNTVSRKQRERDEKRTPTLSHTRGSVQRRRKLTSIRQTRVQMG